MTVGSPRSAIPVPAYVRDGELFADLRAAFDGGDGARLVTVDHEIHHRRCQRHPALRRRAFRRRVRRHHPAGHRDLPRRADLRARRLVLHVAQSRLGCGAEPAPARHVSGTDTWITTSATNWPSAATRMRLRMVGAASEPRTAATPVSGARIQLFASMVRDGNRSYWDAEFARQTWGGLLAPPALLMGWLIPPPWQPGGTAAGGLDGAAGAVAGHHIHQRGQRCRVSASDRRGRSAHRRRGAGVGVAGKADPAGRRSFRRDAGDLSPSGRQTVVARCRNTLFRFTPGAAA